MYKLNRVYMDNVGSVKATFSHLDLSFENVGTGLPDHSILHIDNGGGKTTWLSLYFTLLKPRQDRFIQTIQKKNHRFEDYVKEQPGLILAEFVPINEKDMTTRILGQYVYKRGDDIKRHYFKVSGMRDNENAFLSVPSIGRETLHTIDDINKFLRESGKCTQSHSQAEWMEMIQEDLKMDEALIDAQIDFCRTEGGISDFANFEKETDFLQKFFGMAMRDGQDIVEDDYRSMIYGVIEEHQDLPNLRREVGILSDIRSSIKTFADEADQFTVAQEKFSELQDELGGYRTFLMDEVDRLTKTREKMVSEEKTAKKEFKELKGEIAAALTKLNMFDLLLAELDKSTKDEEAAKVAEDIKSINMKKALFRAVEPYIEYKITYGEMKQKEKIVNDCSKGADAVSAIISDLWMHFAEILNRKIKGHQEIIKETNSRNEKSQGKIDYHQGEIKTLKEEQTAKIKEQLKATSFIETHSREHTKLIEEGYLEEYDSLDGKIVAVERDHDREGMKETDLEQQIKAQTDIIKEKRIKVKGINGQVTEAEKQKAEHFNLLKTAKAETAVVIAEIARFRKVDESEVEPYSDEHKRYIEQNLLETERYAKGLERKIVEIEMEQELIQSGDGTIVDTDVAKVKEQLEELDIRTVFASSYLCDQFNDDTDKVADVVKSDPARFMGLMVYQDEDKAKVAAVIGQLKGIRKPVVISSLSIEASETDSDSLIIEPSTNVLYSKKKTAEYLVELEGELKELREKSEQARQIAQSSRSLLDKLSTFYSKFAEVTVKGHEQEVVRLERKIISLISEREALESELEKLEEKQERNRDLLSKCLKITSLLEQQLKALKRFKNEFDAKLGEFKEKRRFCTERLKAIDEEIKDKETVIDFIKKDIEDGREISRTETDKLATARRHFNKTSIEESSLDDYDFKSELLEMSSDQLREQIGSAEKDKEKALAESGYKAAKEDLETLQKKCASIKTRVQKTMDAIAKEYTDVSKDLTLTFESLEEASKGLSYDDISERTKKAEDKHTELIRSQTRLEGLIEELQNKIDTLRTESFNQDVYTELSVYKTEGLLKGERLEVEEEHSQKVIKIRDIESRLKTLENKLISAKEHLSQYEIMRDTIQTMYEETGRSYEARYIDIENCRVLKEDLIRQNKALKNARDKASKKMDRTFVDFKDQVNKEEIRSNPTYARIINQSLEDMIDTYQDTLSAIEELMKVHEHTLETAASDIKQAVNTLEGKVKYGLKKLKSSMDQRVPKGDAKYSGKLILKVHSNGERLFRMAQNDELTQYLTSYIEDCIEDNVKPVYMMTEAITHVVRTSGINQEGRLGIQILQVTNSGFDYYRIDDIKSSGGERLTTALLLYIIIGSVSGSHGFSGGFLLTDNIFGTCSKASFVGVQLKVAQALNFQIISTTGHHEKGFMSQYPNILSIIPSVKADETGNIINQSCVTKGVFDETRAAS